jgi:hypothetical protein
MLKPPLVVGLAMPEIRWREELSTITNFLFSPQPVAVTSAYTAKYSDGVILANASGGAFSVTLPPVLGHKGEWLMVKRTNTGANAVTLDGNGAETVDGSATLALTSLQGVFLYNDGTQWWTF